MKQKITLHSKEYDLQKSIQKLEENLPSWERDIFLFLVDWFSDSNTVKIQTSGSTGTPKLISKPKSALRNSAFMTGKFFEFSKETTALLCLPTKYIAGKMMLVRAIEWELNLDYIEPKTKLEIPKKNYFFSAMTPPQVQENLRTISAIQNLIIGGAPISSELENEIIKLPQNYYATYGMTESVSHIALRKIGQLEYKTLSNISISLDKRDCLVISAPKLLSEPIITNDLVEITSSNTFLWKGRVDYIINSGGIKISPEIIENKMVSFIPSNYFVAGIPDDKWGEKVVLLIEGNSYDTNELKSSIEKTLPKTHLPKSIFFVKTFQYTENGKLKRKETLEKIFSEN